MPSWGLWNVIYRMGPDRSEMFHCQGRYVIADGDDPSRSWLDKYIHPDDQPRDSGRRMSRIMSTSTSA